MRRQSLSRVFDSFRRKLSFFWPLALIALLWSSIIPLQVQARDGDLDTSFGEGGIVTTDFFHGEDEAHAIAIQSDGKIIAAGIAINPGAGTRLDFALARYNSDGSLDTSFGSGGRVTTDFFGSDDWALAVAIQNDGKIIAAGRTFRNGTGSMPTGFYFALARYNSDGSLDTSFGSGGKVTGDFGELRAVAIQPDGKIITTATSSRPEFAVLRYNGNGSLDSSFGASGRMTTSFFGSKSIVDAETANGVIIQSDGKIIALGDAYDQNTRSRYIALARYNANGALDDTFGSGGRAIGSAASVRAGAIQSDGKIVVVGTSGTFATLSDFNVARFNGDGSVDPSFGSGGTVTTDFSGKEDVARAVAIQPDGKIVVAGSVVNGGRPFDAALARYNSDGSLDAIFGSGGKVTTPITVGDEAEDADISAVAIDSEGRIVVAGGGGEVDFVLVRYLAGQDFALAFDPSTVSAERGTRIRVKVSISRKGGFAGNVTVTPSDTSALGIRVIPDSVQTSGTMVTFKLKIKANAPTGAQQVTFKGRDDTGLERTTMLIVVVQ